jgi:hypothetical protein
MDQLLNILVDRKGILSLIGKQYIRDLLVEYFNSSGVGNCINGYLDKHEQFVDELTIYEYLKDKNELKPETDFELISKWVKDNKEYHSHNRIRFANFIDRFDMHELYRNIPFHKFTELIGNFNINGHEFIQNYVTKINSPNNMEQILIKSNYLKSICKNCSSFNISTEIKQEHIEQTIIMGEYYEIIRCKTTILCLTCNHIKSTITKILNQCPAPK